MIIEDVGEPEGELSKFLKIEFRREEITFTDEESGLTERVGDYTNDEFDFLLERKSAFDYLNSVIDGRYLRQLYKMWKYYEGPKFVVFEGDWEALLKVAAQKGKNMYSFIVASRLKAIAFGVNWIQTWDKSDTAKFIRQLNDFAKHNKEIKIKPRKINLIMCKDERIRVLAMAIGQDKATKILNIYKTIINIVLQLKEDPDKIIEIEGIGPRTVERLTELFLGDREVVFYGRRKKNNKSGTKGRGSGSYSKQSSGVRKTKKAAYRRSQYTYRTSKHDKRTTTPSS